MNKNDGLCMTGCFWRDPSFACFLGTLLFVQQVGAQTTGAVSAAELVGTGSELVLSAPATALQQPTWLLLSSAQKAALMPLERDWDGLDTSSRSKWLGIATRFAALPAEEQARMHERMRAWARSSPADRQRARIGFQVAQQIAVEQRQAKWEAYQALPAEKRQELADKATQKRAAKPPARRVAVSDSPQPKKNLVPAALKGLPVKSVAPSIVQAKPGATTVFMTQIKTLPSHQQAGQTKVFADPDLVDSKTLLPKRRQVAGSP